MATADGDESGWFETDVRWGLDRLTLAVVGVVVLALALRLFALGARTAHWDEGRMGWWILHFIRTGGYEYDAIIHGPFYHHVNRVVFGLLGPSDFSMRLVTALLGGLLPISALGLRHRLRDSEVAILAGFLAVNPIVLYYSRFMRGDPIVAFCMFGAFVLFVRVVDFGSKPALFGGVALVAVALSAKENALVYLVTWVGAAVLLLDHRLFVAGGDWTAVAGRHIRRVAGRVRAWLAPLVAAVAEFAVIVVWFYAPRAAEPGEVGLNNVASDPSMLPAVLREATVGSWNEFYGQWVAGGSQEHAYLPYLGDFVETLAYGALVLCVLAVLGFLLDRYAEDGPTDLVSFAGYWGFVSVLGYPIITDIMAPWATIHAVVPLAIPAAVGFAFLLRWGKRAYAADDTVAAGIAVSVVLLLVATVAGAMLWTVYLAPQAQGNELVQYAQPGDDLGPALERIQAASAAERNGTDVLLYGDYFVDGDENATRSPDCVAWFDALPLPWYFAAYESDVACASTVAQLREQATANPPIVITRDSENVTVRRVFPDYWRATYNLRTYGTETTVLFRPDYADRAAMARPAPP
ncbi:MAG: flippase activity-associated protein Agl23 [Halorientalis sp.]